MNGCENMSKVAFLTDSSCDIPADLAEKYGIEIACFPVNLDGKEYIERRDMTNDEFYQMMREASGCPTTAAITSLQWLEFLHPLCRRGLHRRGARQHQRGRVQHLRQRPDRRQDAGRGAPRLPDEDPPGGQPHLLDGVWLVLVRVRPQGAQRRRRGRRGAGNGGKIRQSGGLPGRLQPEADEEIGARLGRSGLCGRAAGACGRSSA